MARRSDLTDARSPARIVAVSALVLVVGTACAHLPSDKEIDQGHTQYDLGVNEMTYGRYEAALDFFQRSVEFNPNFADVHMGLGLLWWRKAKFDGATENYRKARTELERAVELRPLFSDAWNNLGALCIELKDFTCAISSLKMALSDAIYKTPYTARSNLGWVYHLQGHDRDALAQIREALVAEPTYCVGHKQLAAVLEDMKKHEEAAEEWAAFAKYCADDPDAQFHLGKLHGERGEPEESAMAFLRCRLRALKANPSHMLIQSCTDELNKLPPLPPEVMVRITNEVMGAETKPGSADSAGGGAH
jgi:type IV pilus assembly protein PilF